MKLSALSCFGNDEGNPQHFLGNIQRVNAIKTYYIQK
jgi:hypothetical protein